jgi:sensor domain CHASE-containing protein
MAFRRLGPAILELVEAIDAPAGPARFWGLVVVVTDLEALAARLGDRLGSIRDAVQPGRRIATVRESAGLGQAVAFMSPEAR